MFDERKAAEIAAFLLFRAGAEGMSRRRLLALMYLAEREAIGSSAVLTNGSFMLTEDGPVPKEVYGLVMGGTGGSSGEWALRVDALAAEREPAMVEEGDAGYAGRLADAPERLVLRQPQPPPRWPDEDRTLMDHTPQIWPYREEGMPYLGTFSDGICDLMNRIWHEHGERDEEDLMRHMLELPERGDAVAGELPLEKLLQTLGYTQREVKEHLEWVAELDALDRHKASNSW